MRVARRRAGGNGTRDGRRAGRNAHRLVTRLRRQGEGVGAVRRRHRCDRRRLAGGTRLMDIIDPRIEEYLERLTTPHDDLLHELSEETRSELGSEQMLTGPVAGRFLELLVWFGQPKRIIEIGTFSGHSALSMASALPEGGHVDACELDP